MIAYEDRNHIMFSRVQVYIFLRRSSLVCFREYESSDAVFSNIIHVSLTCCSARPMRTSAHSEAHRLNASTSIVRAMSYRFQHDHVLIVRVVDVS